MKCPHCRVEFFPHWEQAWLAKAGNLSTSLGKNFSFSVSSTVCPACRQGTIKLEKHDPATGHPVESTIVFPRRTGRTGAPPEVPIALAKDFDEAGLVLSDSPTASAALSRRCLQGLLRDQGYAQRDLSTAIETVLSARVLPSALAANLDSIRQVGNFAAHPLKNTNSGEIVPVEDHEAEWNLEVLEGLFDFFYVQPARDAARRAALNQKLQAAGKNPMRLP